MLRSIFILLVFFLALNAVGQFDSVTISGNVIEKSSKQSIEFATVQLVEATDSSIIKAAITDKKGRFSIENISPGKYLIQCSFIGYGDTWQSVSVDGSKNNLQLGNIEIGTVSTNMQEVTVTSRKSMINAAIDRKIYNVSQDVMAQTGSASEVLRNLPSIEVDIEGQVSLRGSANVMILINGRPSPLMGSTRAEALQQLPANSIERIEVITNPSARYRPDGTSGIINIVLKKNVRRGLNGNLTMNAGSRDRYSGGINLNYNPGKFNLFGSYNIRRDRRIRTSSTDRTYLGPNLIPESYYLETSESSGRPFAHILTTGVEFFLDPQNSIGFSGNMVHRKLVRDDHLKRLFFNSDKSLVKNSDRFRIEPETENERDGTFFWQHNYLKEGKELRAELNISSSKEDEFSRNTNLQSFPAIPTSFDNVLMSTFDRQKQVSLDFTDPISDKSKLELGYAGSFTNQDLNLVAEYFDTASSRFVKDLLKSNLFIYKESVHAFYTTFQRASERFSYSAGLRFEQAFTSSNLATKDSLVTNNYFRIYPTLHLAYNLSDGELQLNYSRRVNRPEADELNPFPDYQDPLNLRAGNPKLLPEVIHSVEFGYRWQNNKFSFVPSIYYRYKEDGFTSVIKPLNDSVLLNTEENLSKDRSAGLELVFTAKAGKFFNANMGANFFYNQIDASELGFDEMKSIVSMSLNFNSTFTFTPITMLQFSTNYRSSRLTAQGRSFGSIVFNLGIRQDMFKKKVSFVLTASDLFKSLRQKSSIDTYFLDQSSITRRDGRIFYLGLNFKFGSSAKKAEDKMEFDDSL